MNVIRINWPLVRRLTVLILALYLVYLVIIIAFMPYDSTLHVDPENPGNFLISREHATLYGLSNASTDVNKNDPSKVKFRIKSVLIRYAKTPVEYWAPLIENALKLGANTIQVQVVWNFHEPMFKHFDYNQKSHDLEMFLKLIESYKLFAIVQVDPYYYCSDYDLGGVPSWLLGDSDLERREKSGAGLLNLEDIKFVSAFKKYLESMLWIIGQAQAIFGGPVIGMQVQYYEPEIMQGLGYENDMFKFYGPEYVELIQDKLYQFNIVEMLLRTVSTCELSAGVLDNGLLCDHDLKVYFPVIDSYSRQINNLVYNSDQLLMFKYFYEAKNCFDSNAKYWSVKSLSKNNIPNLLDKSFSEQTEEHRKHADKYKATLNELDISYSYSITNFYCHSNHGFQVAAHHNHLDREQRPEALPISTNHLLGKCLIEENLQPGDKYWLGQQILATPKKLTDSVRIRERKNYRRSFEVDVSKETALPMSHYLTYQNLSGLLEAPLVWHKNHKLFFEFLSLQFPNLQHSQHFHSNSGFMLYRLGKFLVKNTVVRIDTHQIKDYALVICNLKEILMVVDTLNEWRNKSVEIRLDKHCEFFDILVENMGRYSDASRNLHLSEQRKGITSKSAIQYKLPTVQTFQTPSYQWKIFFLDFEEKFIYRISLNSHWTPVVNKRLPTSLLSTPVMTYAKFRVAKTANRLNTVGRGAFNGANQTGIYLLLPHTSWSKGVVFLNNFNLGRYWSVGPLCTIFIPEFMLYDGLNELMIFELNKSSEDLTVYLTHSHVVL